MASRIRTYQKKNVRIQTPEVSTAPAQGMFESRPFAVESQQAAAPQQPLDLNQALMRAQRYGHNLSRMQFAEPSATSVQPKMKMEQPLPFQRVTAASLQAKFALGQPGDKYEQEADQVAARVVSQIQSGVNPSLEPQTAQEPEHHPSVQRRKKKNSSQPESLNIQPLVQRASTENTQDTNPELEQSIECKRGNGQPLSDNIRQPMEQAFGANFSGVKVHTDTQSDQLNQSIQAKAFTTGQDIFFRQGEYDSGSRGGQELIAHELTHVVQQNGSAGQHQPINQANARLGESIQVGNTSTNALPDVVQRKVGFEFEAQWNVRDVSNLTPQEQEDHQTTATARENKISVKIAKLMTSGNYDTLLTDEEKKTRETNQNQLVDSWFVNNEQLNQTGEERVAKVDRERPQIRKEVAQQMMVANVIEEKPLEGRNLGKGGKVVGGTKFALTADASPSGGSNLEWVTAPLENLDEVNQVMDNITAMARYLNSRNNDQYIPSEDVTDGGGTPIPQLRIYPFGGDLVFAPQVTAGLRLDQLSKLIDYLDVKDKKGFFEKQATYDAKKTASRDLYRDKGTIINAQTKAKKVIDQRIKADQRIKEIVGKAGTAELEGLVTLLASYLLNGAAMQQRSNAKSIAGGLMARTDFAHNFTLLPIEYKFYFFKNPDKFVALVLEAADMPGTENEKVFVNTVERGLAGNRTMTAVPLTRGTWLSKIPMGMDLLKNYANLGDTEKGLNEVDQNAWQSIHKSLGALGSVDDKVGPRNQQMDALVVEFRRMQDLLRVDDLKRLAVAVFKLTEQLNRGEKLKYEK